MGLKFFFAKFDELEDKLFKILLYLAGGSLLVLLINTYFQGTKLIPAFGGSYREGVVGVINQINPVLSFNNNVERDLIKFFYPSLMASSTEYSLAQSSFVSDDQKEYTFSLRPDAKWQDGNPITADDVVFTFKIIKNPLYKSPLKFNWEEVKIEKIDNLTVKFILPNPYALFTENLTTGILPKHIWQSITPEDFPKTFYNLNPISGGPYILKEIRSSQKANQAVIQSLELVRNDNYFGQKPYISEILIKFFENEESLFQALKEGDIDGFLLNKTEHFSAVKELKNFNYFHLKLPRYYALFFNQTKSETLKNVKIREIIAMAINRREMIEKIFYGNAELVSTPLPINDYFSVGDVEQLDYDIQKAKVLLESLLDPKNKLDLNLTITVPKDDILIKVANYLKESLEKIGFTIKVEDFDAKTLFETIIKDRDYQMLIFGQALRSNPDPFSFWHSSQVKDPGLNLSLYKNPEVDKILIEARQTSDPQLRKNLYQNFQKQIVKDIPAVFLYRPIQLYVIKNKIKGTFISDQISSSDERFNHINFWYIKQKRVRK